MIALVLEDALCAQTDPELFFPEKGKDNRRAKQVCAACPVRRQCAEWALSSPEHLEGIWGGLSVNERKALRRANRPQREPKRSCGTAAGARQHYRLGERPCEACLWAARMAARDWRSA